LTLHLVYVQIPVSVMGYVQEMKSDTMAAILAIALWYGHKGIPYVELTQVELWLSA
jgi:hypothetical protein